ncbi:ANTAR domain-containing protein [Guyparkeria halopsychrophila]|uniref:ANTAR domain-containing response regulator n=1 Tax=Guyparkeria halopsychrophila TaxID=3139421 RepID=UPI0037C565D4
MRVMLIDQDRGRAAIVEQSLQDAGHEVVARLASVERLSQEVEAHQPDVVIIDIESPDRDALENMSVVSRDNPRPIVLFSEEDSEESIAKAIKAGVSAYIYDGMRVDRVRPIVDVAVARFREFQALRNELDETRTQLEDRKVVEKAKGLLMKHRGFDETQAYHAMRKMAMNRNQQLVETARNVIAVFDLVGDDGI